MSEPNSTVCPRCGAPRATDGTPSCACGPRASDAHLEARAAETAAAEDFDPLRIRPYVELSADTGAPGDATPAPPAEELHTVELPPFLGELATGDTAASPPAEPEDTPPARRSRIALVTLAGAAAAVVAGVLIGVSLYRSPTHDSGVSDGLRARVPDRVTTSAPASPTRSASSSSTSPSATPSPSDSATTPTPSVTSSADPGEGSSPSATGTAAPVPSGSDEQDLVLRFGDTGTQVTELQLRLRQIGYYDGDINGNYDGDVERAVRSYQLMRVILTDESGVYGTPTRVSLESETQEP